MEDHDDFEFNYCPECGSTNLTYAWITVVSGRMRKCQGCGRTWHVILEFPNVKPDDDDGTE